ncbi:MAG: hypothetical protein IJT32_02285, partial [Lachnospiraceae bacterium]|nr:hypothetical protein [Lachnospiraceae bacterium]
VGEFSIDPIDCRILDEISEYPVMILTNAFLLKQEAIRALERSGIIFCSVDAGTRDTFRRVKGADAFERVSDNLREYARHGPVSLKYILLDGVNDSTEDLEGFFRLADEVGVRVSLSRNYLAVEDRFSERALDFAARFIHHFRESGRLNMNLNGFLRPGEEDRIEMRLSKL